jgi:TrmH family RNA methyltransferase
MIPLYKLEKLPRFQRYRKIAKFFSMAENRLIHSAEKKVSGIYTVSELVFFCDAAKLLINETSFSALSSGYDDSLMALQDSTLLKAPLLEARDIFEQAVQPSSTVDLLKFRRALNNVKHILLTKTGDNQADWDFTGSDGRLDQAKRRIFKGMQVYMEDIRSPFNVGAMFRTSESFGVEKIILSPFCADPNHRRAQRTAMGCIDIVPWVRQELFSPVKDSAENCKIHCAVFALETGGVPLHEFQFPQQGLLIAGSEELGVSPQALAAADTSFGRVSIPCYGAKASLNVSVAFGIVMQVWAQRLNL